MNGGIETPSVSVQTCTRVELLAVEDFLAQRRVSKQRKLSYHPLKLSFVQKVVFDDRKYTLKITLFLNKKNRYP